MRRLFEQLKRRNVLRVAAGYTIVGWLIIQVADTVFPNLGVPGWVTTMTMVLVIIGFPVSIIVSWIYQWTPAGILTDKAADAAGYVEPSGIGRQIGVVIIVLLIIAVSWLIYDKEKPALAAENSIAVLPFINMSADEDQEYFSDGISEEILNVLTPIKGLRVTSRTSSFSFKDKNVSIPEIAMALGVAHILEGSVRKSGNRVRITAQLIEVSSDRHLWSETYDRELSDIFLIQDEISAAIVAALRLEILGESAQSLRAKNVDAKAHDLYLRGLAAMHNPGAAAGASESAAYFEDAIQLDANILPAYAALVLSLTYLVDSDLADDDVLERAEEVAKNALALDPNFGPSQVAMGRVAQTKSRRALKNGDLVLNEQFDREALQYLERANGLGGLNASDLAFLASKYSGERALELYKRAALLNPLEPYVYVGLANKLVLMGRVDEALEAAKNAIAADPAFSIAWHRYGWLTGYYNGDVADAVRHFSEAIRLNPEDFDWSSSLAFGYVALGDGDAAELWADRAIETGPNIGVAIFAKVTQLILAGETDEAIKLARDSLLSSETRHRIGSYRSLEQALMNMYFSRGDFAAAESFLLEQHPQLLDLLQSQPTGDERVLGQLKQNRNPPALLWSSVQELATIYAETGRSEQAVRLRDHLAFFTPEQILAGDLGVLTSGDFLRLAASAVGRLDDGVVLSRLQKSVDLGYLLGWRTEISMSPHFWPLRNHPRFIAIIAEIEAEMARQLAELKARPTVADVGDAA